jgi:YVTN family beta-propeller protein
MHAQDRPQSPEGAQGNTGAAARNVGAVKSISGKTLVLKTDERIDLFLQCLLHQRIPFAAHTAGADPAAGAPRLYVSDERGGNVVIVDPQSASVIARIPVGKRPRGIQVSPDHKRVYVALSGSPQFVDPQGAPTRIKAAFDLEADQAFTKPITLRLPVPPGTTADAPQTPSSAPSAAPAAAKPVAAKPVGGIGLGLAAIGALVKNFFRRLFGRGPKS